MKRLVLQRPLVAFSWAWTAGYGIAILFPRVIHPFWAIMGAAVLLAVCFGLRLSWRHYGVLLILGLLGCGYFQWVDGRNESGLPHPGDTGAAEGIPIGLEGRIGSVVTVDGDKVSFVLQASSAGTAEMDEGRRVNERVQVSVRLLEQSEQNIAHGWERGDWVKVAGMLRIPSTARNFGGFDYRAYLRTQRIHAMLTVKGTEELHVTEREGFDWLTLLRKSDRLRNGLGETVNRLFPAAQSGYMQSLLIGLRADMDPEEFQQFSRLGLTHLLAISGLHVGVFVASVLWLFRVARLPKENALLITIWLLPAYILLTGASPSVIRAGFMAMLALYGARKQWLKDGMHLICIVGWAMLVWNPYYVKDVGFQLSFLVTIGLIAGVPKTAKLLPIRSEALKSTIAVTLVSQAVSFPLSVYYFNQFSLVSWLANMVLVPLVSFVVTPLGSVALLVGTASLAVGRLLAIPVIWLNRLNSFLVDAMDRLSMFHLIWPSPSIGWLASWYILLALLLNLAVRRKTMAAFEKQGIPLYDPPHGLRAKLMIPACIAAAAALLLYGYSPDRWENGSTISFLDVGQGDAIWVHTSDDKNVLIDGGGTLIFRKAGEEWKKRSSPYEVGNKLVVPLLKKRGVHSLDAIIITHLDTDHIGGLQAVLEQIPVRRIIFNGTVKHSANAVKLFQTANRKRIPLLAAGRGDNLAVGGTAAIRFLYPNLSVQSGAVVAEAQNNLSLVFMLAIDGYRFLFTGDMEKSEEWELLDAERQDAVAGNNGIGIGAAPIDVLKIAHHGSKTSTTEEWLRVWRPSVSVMSVGVNNAYKHPSAEVVERIEAGGSKLFRTDRFGEVQMTIKRGALRVRTMLVPSD